MKVEYGKTGTYFYLIGLIFIAIFLPTSKFGLSVSQFYLLALWMLVGLDMRAINKMYQEDSFLKRILKRTALSFKGIWHNIKTRFTDFLHNKVAVIMASVFVMHIIGLIYTSDFQYAFKDIRIKLPLLLFPIIISSFKPLNRKQFDSVIWFFISSVFFVSVLGAIKFLRRDFVDVRELSVFVSHIRVSLCIVLSIFSLAYFLVKRNYNIYVKAIIIFLIVWFLWNITILESFIALVIIVAFCASMLLYFIYKSHSVLLKISATVVFILTISAAILIPSKIIKDYNTPDKTALENLDTHTKLGNPYVFDTINFGIEDGKYVGLYIAKDEMMKAWNERSEKKISHEYTEDYHCLVRYLASKDLRKDAEGIAQLTESDINNIENNIANYNYIANPGFRTRIMKIMVAYNHYVNSGDANGSSVFQRIEFIKASFDIIKENPAIGIGTGDIAQAFEDYYNETNSKLKPENRLRCHNQYLAITIAFGIIGLLWFVFCLIYPVAYDRRNRNFLYITFLFVIMISMLSEDTIETQIGVTLFAFFNSFLVFASPSHNDISDKNQTDSAI